MIEILNNIQKELKAPKSNVNEFGKYKYRSCEDILEAVKPLLSDTTALLLSDEIVQIGDRYYVKATATLKNGKDQISVSAFAREPVEKKGSDASQITGAASSYARKYALNGLFCIDDTKDADATNDHGKSSKTDFKPIDKSSKDIHKEWKDGIDLINNTTDHDSALEVGRYQWKRLKELGASEQELDLIKQQAQNHATYLQNKEFEHKIAAE